MKDTGPGYSGLGWGGKGEKQTIRKKCHEVESGQGEVHGHNNNLCLASKMIMNAWCICLI